MRPRSSSTASETVMIAWSTSAARIWPSDRLDDVDRANAVRRGSRVRTYPGIAVRVDGGPVARADDLQRVAGHDELGVRPKAADG